MTQLNSDLEILKELIALSYAPAPFLCNILATPRSGLPGMSKSPNVDDATALLSVYHHTVMTFSYADSCLYGLIVGQIYKSIIARYRHSSKLSFQM
jgi:hypothetical protein